MIYLTRLNKRPVMINSDLIKFVENTPDTVVTLISGEKLVVGETLEQILERVIDFRRRLLVWPKEPDSAEASDSAPADDKTDAEE